MAQKQIYVGLVEEYNIYRKLDPAKEELFEMVDCLRTGKTKYLWDELPTDTQEDILKGWLVIIQKYPKLK